MKRLFYIILLIIAMPVKGQLPKKSTIVYGHADFLKNGDSVNLIVYKHGIHYTGEPFTAEYVSKVVNHVFSFSWCGIGYPQAVYIKFKGHDNMNLYDYIVQSGDKIHLIFKDGNLSVQQLLDSSFVVQKRINLIENGFYQQKTKHRSFDASSLEANFIEQCDLADQELRELNKSKRLITPIMYRFLQHRIEFDNLAYRYHLLDLFGIDAKGAINKPLIDSFISFTLSHPEQKLIADSLDVYSPAYINYLYLKYAIDSCLLKKQIFQTDNAINFFAKHYTGTIREQLITQAISQTENFDNRLAISIQNNIKYVQNPEYQSYIKNTLSRVDGAKAFNFSLVNINDKHVTLTDFPKKVVVLDFWYTGCGNCRQLSPYMKIIEKTFHGNQVVFIGIGIDKNKEQWSKSMQSGIYVSPDIINLYTGGKGADDPVTQHYHVDGYPTVVLISKTGNVVNLKNDPRLDNGRELISKIEACLN